MNAYLIHSAIAVGLGTLALVAVFLTLALLAPAFQAVAG